jgi:hypothetical protein
MALDGLEAADMILQLENFTEKLRPKDPEILKKLDYGYSIENQSILLFEIRPDWRNPAIIRHEPFAKTTYVKRQQIWKVYWLRGNLKWYPYNPKPTVRSLKKFLEIVEEDEYHCFFG